MTNGNGNGSTMALPEKPDIRFCAAQSERDTRMEIEQKHLRELMEDKVSALDSRVARVQLTSEATQQAAQATRETVGKGMSRIYLAIALACLTFAANVVFLYVFNVKLDGLP